MNLSRLLCPTHSKTANKRGTRGHKLTVNTDQQSAHKCLTLESMATLSRPIVVQRVPETMTGREARAFYEAVLPVVSSDRPRIVFDMSRMRHVDSVGIAVFLRCICQAAKGDGDIKLAGMLPQAAVVFELTRIGQLFEMYENSIAAVMSYNGLLPNTPSLLRPPLAQLEAASHPPDARAEDGGVEGAKFAA